MTRLSKLSRSIEGKIAIITGAASGMGRATALLFADEGAKVVVVDLNVDAVDAVVMIAILPSIDLLNFERRVIPTPTTD